MFKRLPVLYKSAVYSFRGCFLIRPFLIVLGLGAAGAVLSALEEQFPPAKETALPGRKNNVCGATAAAADLYGILMPAAAIPHGNLTSRAIHAAVLIRRASCWMSCL
jgi:hypothetical protein